MLEPTKKSVIGSGRLKVARVVLASAGALAVCLALAVPAAAQNGKGEPAADPGGANLKLELNRVEPAGDNCKTTFVIDNRGPALKSLKVNLYAFDTEGVVLKSIAIELGPLQEKKTRVRPFDFVGVACPKIGRLLLNDVLSCEGEGANPETCLDRIATSSKASVPLDR